MRDTPAVPFRASRSSLERGRIRDPADRRRHIVEITPEGSERIPVCDAPLDQLEDQLFAGLSADERERLRDLLERTLTEMSIEEPPLEDQSSNSA